MLMVSVYMVTLIALVIVLVCVGRGNRARGRGSSGVTLATGGAFDRAGSLHHILSVAERSFPLLDLLEMNCQPRAQLLLHRWG